MDNKMDYVPADIVKMLFEQSKNAIDSNTIAIKEMTNSVNELSKILAAPPTGRDILDVIKEHEIHCSTRVKENIIDIEKIEVEDEKRFNTITTNLGTIKEKINTIQGRINLMILVVSITFTLISITYVYVNNSVNTSIKHVLEENLKNK